MTKRKEEKKAQVNIDIYKRDGLWHVSLWRKNKYGTEVIVMPEINLYRKPKVNFKG